MGLSLRNVTKKIRDVFDANTQADQQKRVAAGQPRMYADQQRQLQQNGIQGTSNKIGQNVYNAGRAVVQGFKQAPNQIGTGLEEAFNGGRTESQFAASNNRTQEILRKVNSRLADPNLSPEQRSLQMDVKSRLRNIQSDTVAEQDVVRREGLEKLDPLKNAAAYTSAYSDIATAPLGAGKGALLRKAAASAAPAAVSGGLSPVIDKGNKVTFKDVAIGAGTGAAIGAALPVAGEVIGKVAKKAKPLNVAGSIPGEDPDVTRKLVQDYIDNPGRKVPDTSLKGEGAQLPTAMTAQRRADLLAQTQAAAKGEKPKVTLRTAPKPEVVRVNEVLNPDAPDFLQVKRGEASVALPSKYSAPNLPVSKPGGKATVAPAGVGTIPLDQLGKEVIKEGDPRLVTGRVAKDEVVQDVLQGISKSRGRAGVEGSVVASDIASEARKYKVKLDRGFIDRYQAGTLANDAEKAVGARIKSVTDELFLKQQQIDPTIQYRSNYVPQSYEQGADVVEEAARQLQQRTGAANRRAFDTYKEAESFGLTPKFKTIDEMIGSSAQNAQSALENKALVKRGLEGGVFTTEPVGAPVIGIKSPDGAQVYAQKNVADTLNGILQENTQGLAGATRKAANLSGAMQDVMLQGGVPGTNANFFVAGQAVKDTTRNIGKFSFHPIQAVKQEGNLVGDFFRGKAKTQARFAEGSFKAGGQQVKNADFVRQMADRGLYIQPQTSLTGQGKNKVSQAWNTLGNNPTFGRYMPNRLLSTAQEVYSQSVKKLGPEKAADLAAETTKRFTGQVDTILKGRSNLTQDASSVILFAPKYRESIIDALGNVVKSVYPAKWADKSYAPSRQLLAGMAVTLAGYEALNREITGHSMFENRQGQELSVQIPYGEKDEKGNQPVINIPFMPGFMTIPRAIVGAGSAIKNGDLKGVGAEASKALSAPLQTAGRVISNQDYFGRPIYNDEKNAASEGTEVDNPLQAGGKIAQYVAGQALPSWVRGAMDVGLSDKPIEQGIATALEAPVRFGKELKPETAAYFADREDVYNSLDKNSRAVWDAIHPKVKNIKGEYITDKTVDSGLARASNYLNNPDVLEAENEMARRARARGEKVDPLFGELQGEQQRIALRIDTLPPKDPNKTILKKQNPWYQDYADKRAEFFDSIPPGDPNKPKAPIAYPEPSGQVAAIQDAYYQTTDSAMRRQIITDNPDLADQFAKEEQYTRAVRAAKNLPQYDKYPEPSKDVQGLMDTYSALPKKEAGGKSKIRSAWIKSHPNEWTKMTEQFSKQAQFNLQQDAQLAAFEGQDLTDKGIKAIASLGGGSGGGGGYGGGGSNGDPSADAFKYAVSITAGGKVDRPKVSVKKSGKTVSKKKSGKKPKVSLKRSLV